MPRIWIALLLASVLSIASGSLPDVPVAVLEGTVTNDIGAPLPDVVVRLRNSMSGTVVQTTTDRQGGFLFKDLPQGRYSLWATADGYGSVWIREIILNAGERVRHDIKFQRRIPTA